MVATIFSMFGSLVFPASCLSCQGRVEGSNLLCENCMPLLELIDPTTRCKICFSEENTKSICRICSQAPPHFDGIAAAFDYIGPIIPLVRKFKYGNKPFLAKGLASYMVAQMIQMEWSVPDLIVPVPLSFSHWLQRGYNQSLLLAKEVSKLLQSPVEEVLVRQSGDYTQSGLNKKQRLQLSGERFKMKGNRDLSDKTILLIDDVMTTGSTLRQCAKVLMEACPKSVHGLTICRAIE